MGAIARAARGQVCAFPTMFPWWLRRHPERRLPESALTTVRQPLREMGRIAAETLLRRIRRSGSDSHRRRTMVEPNN